MATGSVSSLIDALRKSRLMESSQLDELVAELKDRCPDARSFAMELLKRDLLTPYQANQLFTAGAKDLVLGPYVLMAKLGDGLMGPVYKARHKHMNRLVALKVIRAELLAQEDAVERFYELTMRAGQLSHPHIVHAYDSGPIGNTHFFAMEFVDGIDLEKLVAQSGPLQIPVACDYIRQAALGLQHAHERGMLHRDVKPSNLIATRPGASTGAPGGSGSGPKISAGALTLVKIRNLGLNLLEPATEEQLARMGPDGKSPRTPDYLAPERARPGGGKDIRSDLYSLGCTFYYLLTGRVPFPGGTPVEKLRRHQTEEPVPLTLLRRDTPPGVVALVSKLMAKRMEARYQTPGEVAAALTSK